MNQQINLKIKEAKVRKGWSQKDIAEKLNISQTAYGKIENGETRLGVYRLVDLSKLLDLNPAELLQDENKSKIINFNQDQSNGHIKNYYYSDLKEAHEKHIESLQNQIVNLNQIIERQNEELKFWRKQFEKK